MKRTQTKQIHVGPVAIGGGAPVAVQSMCNTHTSDARATIEQIARYLGLALKVLEVRRIAGLCDFAAENDAI